MFKCTFAILFCVMFSVNDINATMLCPVHVLKSLIRCLLETKIQPLLEMNGLAMNTFSQRLQCAKQAECTPSIWGNIPDKNIRVMKNFVQCMNKIPISSWIGVASKVYLEKLVHVSENKCRENLALTLPYYLKHYYLPLLGQNNVQQPM